MEDGEMSSESSFIYENNHEIRLGEDSDDDILDEVYDDENIHELFGASDDDESDFEGFPADEVEFIDEDSSSSSSSDNDTSDEQPASKKKKGTNDGPDDWNMKHWKHGDHTLQPLPTFTAKPGFNIDIPDDADELYFFQLFFTDEILQHLTDETNRYAKNYFELCKDKLKPSSDLKKWPDTGVSIHKMRAFFALTFYMGIVKKNLLKSYWTTDSVLSTPFTRTVMSRVQFYNIMAFLHCCNSAEYPSKGQPGYNPKKKFGKMLPILQEKFQTVWTPRKHVSIDEGTVPFKGHVHFKVYNPNKPDKYGIKTFKLCDSSNSYCYSFDIYVGQVDDGQVPSKFGKTYDLVMRLSQSLLKKGYIIYMDNFYTSPYLFYNLRMLENTAACGTARPRKGLPDSITKAKFKECGSSKEMTYKKIMVALKMLDRKYSTLLSTKYNCHLVDTGKKIGRVKK